MKRTILKFGTSKLKRNAKPLRGRTVVDRMTGNSNFPVGEAGPLLTRLSTACDNLENANEDAASGSHEAVAIADAMAEEWNIAYQAVCAYVQSKADANMADAAAIILSAGFEIRKTRQPQPAPAAVSVIDAVMTGTSGEILVFWKRPKYTKQTNVYMSTTPNVESSWVLVQSVQGRKLLVDHLASGTRYWFRVVAVSSRNLASPPSDLATQIAA